MDSKDQVINAIAEIVNLPKEAINEDTKLSDIAHDSIKLFELFIRLENEMEGTLTYDEVAHIESVGDVIRFIDLNKRGTILVEEGTTA